MFDLDPQNLNDGYIKDEPGCQIWKTKKKSNPQKSWGTKKNN